MTPFRCVTKQRLCAEEFWQDFRQEVGQKHTSLGREAQETAYVCMEALYAQIKDPEASLCLSRLVHLKTVLQWNLAILVRLVQVCQISNYSSKPSFARQWS